MTKNLKTLLGIFCISLPFVALFIFASMVVNFFFAVGLFFATGLIVALIGMGVNLLND
jgi:hypothetical protein